MTVAIELRVRRAGVSDAVAACDCVRRSITELCIADHRGDAATLDAWPRNKTGENFERWIDATPDLCWVALCEDRIAGYAQCDGRGQVLLLYIEPRLRGHGVSSALLAAMEAAGRERGLAALTLDSTQTALRFYLSRGFVPAGAARPGFGVSLCQPLVKALNGGGAAAGLTAATPA